MRTESTTKAYKNLLFSFEDNAKNEWTNWVQCAEIIDYEKEQVKYRAFKKSQKHYNTNGLDFGIDDN